jgi:hypothetical protein
MWYLVDSLSHVEKDHDYELKAGAPVIHFASYMEDFRVAMTYHNDGDVVLVYAPAGVVQPLLRGQNEELILKAVAAIALRAADKFPLQEFDL